ncbi:MAG: SDR family oxidoreductase [candidate division NC10 bacterium]|nr:SDR family oxidoreductase [candidate division NC10 bacterium]
MRLPGKVAIVTGGGSGIGEATAMLFGREGARVVVADIRGEAAERTARLIQNAGGAACAIPADVTKAHDVERMVQGAVQGYGRLDILVNNAGTGIRGDVLDLSEDDWDRVMDANLKGVFFGCKYAIPAMIKSGGGAIVNTASIYAVVGGSLSCVYPATKAGVVAFSKHTALRYARHNIRVNCVCPGHTDTPLIQGLLGDPEARKELLKSYPLGRLGRPMDVAYAMLFLASDEAAFITGTELLVDGGYTAQ